MSPNVFRVVLYDLTAHDSPANFLGRNHSIESGHLPDGMWEKENFPSRGFDYSAPKLDSLLP